MHAELQFYGTLNP